MNLLAIDLSSALGSIALVCDGVVVAEKQWQEDFKNRQALFDGLAMLQTEQGFDWETIDGYAVGRGPGAFSGMRISLSVTQALAAPDKKPVYALNSGYSIAAQSTESSVAVVGDARRGQVWGGLFQAGNLEKAFVLMPAEELSDFIPSEALVLSPDADRLKEVLKSFRMPETRCAYYPVAGVLGQLVSERIQQGIATEPLEPLYMHPPVFVKPRFPA